MNDKTKIILGATVIVIIALMAVAFSKTATPPLGSVTVGNSYDSTFTGVGGTATQVIKARPGVLGSVVITGAGGEFTLYNATTSNVSLRALATSSLTKLAVFPTNAAAGTYVFDTVFTQGLLAVWGGTSGTTTITSR